MADKQIKYWPFGDAVEFNYASKEEVVKYFVDCAVDNGFTTSSDGSSEFFGEPFAILVEVATSSLEDCLTILKAFNVGRFSDIEGVETDSVQSVAISVLTTESFIEELSEAIQAKVKK